MGTGVNFTIILWAVFVPVDFHWTYCRMVQNVQDESWGQLQALCTSGVGRSFIGETEWHLSVPNDVCQHICALYTKSWWNWPDGVNVLDGADVMNARMTFQKKFFKNSYGWMVAKRGEWSWASCDPFFPKTSTKHAGTRCWTTWVWRFKHIFVLFKCVLTWQRGIIMIRWTEW